MRPYAGYESPTVSVVIPALNEARNLEVVLLELPAVHQVILIDGGSVDDTVGTARRIMPEIEVVHQTRRGKGNALVCGFARATGDIIVMFDADGSADPAEIPAFVAALVAGADFAKGSRFRSGGGSHDITRFRSTGNLGLNLVSNLLMRTRFTDLCYGYNAFWARVLPALNLPDHAATGTMLWGDGFEIETVLCCRIVAARLAVTEVPSIERKRLFGTSNLNALRDGFRVLRTILTERYSAGRASLAPTANANPPAEKLVVHHRSEVMGSDVPDGADADATPAPGERSWELEEIA